MKKALWFGSALAGIGMLLCGELKAADQYEIKFNRPDAVGEACKLDASATLTMGTTIFIDGTAAQQQKMAGTAVLKGTGTVLAVNGTTKEASKVKVKVESMKVVVDGQEVPVAKAGDELVFEKAGGQQTVTVNGEPVGKEMLELLACVVRVRDPNETTSDDVLFGSAGKKKAGDEWDINTKAAAVEIAKEVGCPVTEQMLKCKVKLLEFVTAGGEKCAKLKVDMELSGLQLPLPPGVKTVSSSMRFTANGFLPVDPKSKYSNGGSSLSISLVAAGNVEGKQVKMEISRIEESHSIATPVKK